MVTQGQNKTWRIDGWQNGIGSSPLYGFSDMRNMNVSTLPGLAKLNWELRSQTIPQVTAPTFTADAGTDIITLSSNLEGSSNVLLTYQAFTLTTTGTLPAGLSLSTTYYAIRLSSTTMKIATTLANAVSATAINITDAGTGTHTFNLIRPARIKHFTRKPDSYIFALDETGRLWFDDQGSGGSVYQWYLLDGNTRTNAEGDGLVYWKNYVFVFRNSAIDVLAVSGLTTYTITWSNSWQAINGNSRNHTAIVGQDDIIYFCNGEGTSLGKYFIGSIAEATAPFAPGTGASFTFNAGALDLPKQPISLCELGSNLLIGTTGREIYPWNRIAPSFSIPIVVNESNIYSMVNRNNIAYIFAGQTGTIYSTTGSNVSNVNKIPDHLTGGFYTTQLNAVYFNQAIPLGQKILFSLKTSTEGYVCSLDPENNNAISIENTFSIGSTTITEVGGIFRINDSAYFVSWETSSAASIDYNRPYLCDNYESFCTTEFFSPADATASATLNQIEISLIKPLTTGQAVRISYRLSYADAFTELLDVSYTTYGAIQQKVFSGGDIPALSVSDVDRIQIKVEIDTVASSLTTPELEYIDLIFN